MSRRYFTTFLIILFVVVQYFAITQSFCTVSNQIVASDHLETDITSVTHKCEAPLKKTVCTNPSHDCCGDHIPVSSFLKASNSGNMSQDVLNIADNTTPLTEHLNSVQLIFFKYSFRKILNEFDFPDPLFSQISTTIIIC